MYYFALSLGVLQHIGLLPRFLVTCAIWCVLEYSLSFRELILLRKECQPIPKKCQPGPPKNCQPLPKKNVTSTEKI